MKAMILAAGHGTRMRPLTDNLPKPMLEVAGKSLLVWHIERLKASGIHEFVINIAWKGWKIPEALGDGSALGVSINYSDEQESEALETAGGIIKALPLLGDEPFLVVNGDVWCDPSYAELQLTNDDLAQLLLVENPSHNPDGDFRLKDSRVSGNGEPSYTFAGIGLYSPELFAGLSVCKAPLGPLLREAMADNRVAGSLFAGDWRDIGTPERLEQLNSEIEN